MCVSRSRVHRLPSCEWRTAKTRFRILHLVDEDKREADKI